MNNQITNIENMYAEFKYTSPPIDTTHLTCMPLQHALSQIIQAYDMTITRKMLLFQKIVAQMNSITDEEKILLIERDREYYQFIISPSELVKVVYRANNI